MGCQHLEDVYELFLLGTISPEEAREVEGHLARGCPRCLAELHEATLTVYLLTRTARSAKPDPKQKSRLLRSLRKK